MKPEHARSLALGGLLLLLVSLGAGVLARATDPTRANYDVAWALHGGAILLDGGTFGVDVIDSNPPLVFWLGAAETALARASGASALAVHAVLTLLAAGLAAALARRLLADAVLAPELADAAGLLLLACFVLIPGFEYGQRDHWAGMLVMPVVLVAGRRLAGLETRASLRGAAGVLAALGIALKPHYVLMWAGVEGLVALRRRSARSALTLESGLIVGLGAAYVAAVLLWAPAYVASIEEIRRLHGAYDVPIDWLSVTHVLWLAAAACLGLLRLPGATARVAWTLTAASALALFVLHLQAKDWAYHHLPAQLSAAAALIVMGVGLFSAPGSWDERVRLAPRAVAGGAALVWSCVVLLSLQAPAARRVGVEALAKFIDQQARGGEVLALNSLMYPFFPAVEFSDSRSALPYSCLWLLIGRYSQAERDAPQFPYRTLEQMPEGERRFVEAVANALAREPALVLIDRTPILATKDPIDFRRYFSADPRFARRLRGYWQLDSIHVLDGIWRKFDVFVRDRQAPAGPTPASPARRSSGAGNAGAAPK